MSKRETTIDMLASLCDAMKYLERAVAANAPDDIDYYIGQCEERRKRVQHEILREHI